MRVKILCPDGVHYVRTFTDGVLDAKASTASTWEVFDMEVFSDGRFALKTIPAHPLPERYVRAVGGGGNVLSADRCQPNDHEKFTLVKLDHGKVAIRTHEGNFWRAKQLGGADLDSLATARSTWEVFEIQPVT